MSKKKKSIANLFSSIYIAGIILLTITLASIFIINRFFNFYEDSRKIEETFLTGQIHLIRLKLNEVIDYIEYSKGRAEEALRQKIKSRVCEAYQVALKIYNNNKNTKSATEIKSMIKETLGLLRFNQGRGYYFIKDINSNVILYPPNRDVENGAPSADDPIREYVNMVTSKGEGFLSYDWYKPGQDEIKNKKATYVKLFAPFNWIIGTGDYLEEVEKETRNSVKERIEKLKFGKQGRYRIFCFEIENTGSNYRYGEVLIEPKILEETDQYLTAVFRGEKGDHISKEFLKKISEKKEGTINVRLNKEPGRPYTNKLIYFKLYPGWNWVIGSGFYPEEFKSTLAVNRKELEKEVITEIILVIAILVVVLFIAIMVSNFFAKKIKKEFDVFAKFLRESVKKNKLLDKKQLKVAEFQELATSANKMITDKKKGEEALLAAKEMAEAAAKSKSDFLANMSHEIRTPMNAIVGMSDLLFQSEMNEAQRECINIINSSSNKLLTIINEILDLSKIEANKFDLERENFNIRDVVEEVSDIVAIEAHKKNLELIIFLEPEIPLELTGDPARLHQILVNLVNNAVKFTEKGEIVISVEKEEERENQVKLLFKVKDTGIGISVENKKKLFTSFSQIDATATRKYGGTGLGLAISKRLTELMKGEIGVDSREGIGATFWFTAVFEKVETIQKECKTFLPGFKDLRVLIVDDNETNRFVLRSYLRSWGCRCHCAEKGKEAIKKMRLEFKKGRSFEVALLDFRMPELTGEQMAAIIKNDVGIKETKLILLSPTTIHENPGELQKSGISALLNKPVKQSQLFNSISRVMGFDQHISRITKNRFTVSTAIKGKKSEPLNILLVEDNIFNQKVVVRNLQRFGHAVDVAENGKIAVEKFKSSSYDLILMDVQMPEMDGYEATQIIRSMEKEIREQKGREIYTPIIAMTANAMKEDEEKSLNAGMDAHLSKPFNSEKFIKTINRIINRNYSRLMSDYKVNISRKK